MEMVRCNLCDGIETAPLYKLPDYLLGRTDVWAQLVKCRFCGLVYQNPRPTSAEMAVHYPPEYESFATGPANKASWALRQAINYGNAKRIRIVTRYRRCGRLLDVGCAAGVFLNSMRAVGQWDVFGVEINAYAAELARERYQLNVRVGTLEQAAFPDDFFDVVTMWDVLEHLHEPLASLREIYRILKPDGLILVRVPNLDSRDASLFGRYWAGLDAPRHLFVFNQHTLSALLQATGFRIRTLNSGIGAYTTFLLSLRFWCAARTRPNGLCQSIIRFLYHPAMRLLSGPIFYLRSLGLQGPSLVVVAAKANQESVAQALRA
jgi:SAM-dependent methyltransferase